MSCTFGSKDIRIRLLLGKRMDHMELWIRGEVSIAGIAFIWHHVLQCDQAE